MIIWITGASSGLGRELALRYAAAGHKVCVSARNVDALEELQKSNPGEEGGIYAFVLDITDDVQVREAFRSICDEVGVPDLSILNAGTHQPNSAANFDSTVFRKIMDTNFMGVVNCLQEVVPEYLKQRGGKIAVVSSVAGYRGLPDASAYGASKAALINMCEALAPELEVAGISLCLVNPGFVKTPLTDLNEFPMPFLMEVEDAATQMISGLESDRFEITFPKRFTWLLKLLRVLPYALYFRLTRQLVK